MVTPLTVTIGWLRHYLRFRGEGKSEIESRQLASKEEGIKGKAYSRCEIRGYRLTIPVEGGASELKRRNSKPLLSEHGKWRREHLGAWNAAYGRTPYFIHLYPEIEAVYENCRGMNLEEFNSTLFGVAMGWLDIENMQTGDSELQNSRLQKIAEETEWQIEAGISVFDLLFRIGPDAVFALYNPGMIDTTGQ